MTAMPPISIPGTGSEDSARNGLHGGPQRVFQPGIGVAGRHARRSRSLRHAARASATSRSRTASGRFDAPANTSWSSNAASSASGGRSGPSRVRNACSRRSAARHPMTRRRRSADVVTGAVCHLQGVTSEGPPPKFQPRRSEGIRYLGRWGSRRFVEGVIAAAVPGGRERTRRRCAGALTGGRRASSSASRGCVEAKGVN